MIYCRCTSLYGTPTMFVDILNLPDLKSYDISSLSTGYMAGAPCPQSIVKAVVQDLHMKDFVVYPRRTLSNILFVYLNFKLLGGIWNDGNESSDFFWLFF